MKLVDTAIPEVKLLEPRLFSDERGFFMEIWNRQTFADAGLNLDFVQDNHSRSSRGTLRGLHYQIRDPQGKLARVIHGEVYDVAVDLRRSSPTFGKWVGAILSAKNHRMLWIPPGFGHGFVVLTESADFLYKCTNFYNPEYERGIRWNDPDLAIQWPLPPGSEPVLSPKDAAATWLKDAELYD